MRNRLWFTVGVAVALFAGAFDRPVFAQIPAQTDFEKDTDVAQLAVAGLIHTDAA